MQPAAFPTREGKRVSEMKYQIPLQMLPMDGLMVYIVLLKGNLTISTKIKKEIHWDGLRGDCSSVQDEYFSSWVLTTDSISYHLSPVR